MCLKWLVTAAFGSFEPFCLESGHVMSVVNYISIPQYIMIHFHCSVCWRCMLLGTSSRVCLAYLQSSFSFSFCFTYFYITLLLLILFYHFIIASCLSFTITPISTFNRAFVSEIQQCLPVVILHCLQIFYHNIDHHTKSHI